MKIKSLLILAIAFVLSSFNASATTNSISMHSATPVSGANVISTAPVNTVFYIAWTFTTTGSVPASGTLTTDGDGTSAGEIIVKQAYAPVHVSGNQYYIVYQVEIDDNQNLNVYKVKFDLTAYDNSFPLNAIETYDDATVNTSSVLPVELINFKVESAGQHAIVSWSTASEQNNSHFELQKRSSKTSWSTLAHVQSKAAAGNSTEILNYAVEDVQDDNVVYYRLLQVDIDGRTDSSSVIKHQPNLKKDKVDIWPNPSTANDEVTLRWGNIIEQGKLIVKNSIGITVVDESLSGIEHHLHIDKLKSGFYYIQVYDDLLPILQCTFLKQ